MQPLVKLLGRLSASPINAPYQLQAGVDQNRRAHNVFKNDRSAPNHVLLK
jgi:hypothetical protein